jgi:DNA-binding PadR family transcriptional regulator
MLIIISKAQGRALEKLMALAESDLTHPYATARMLKESLPTLRALHEMGFVSHRRALRIRENPRDDTYWQITESGKSAFPSVEVVL